MNLVFIAIACGVIALLYGQESDWLRNLRAGVGK